MLKAELSKYKQLYLNLCGNEKDIATPNSPNRVRKIQNGTKMGSNERTVQNLENTDENRPITEDIRLARQLLSTFTLVSDEI